MGHLCRARQSTGCQLLQAQLRELGVDLRIDLVDEGEWNRARTSLDFDSQQGRLSVLPIPGRHRGRLRHLLCQPRLLRQARGPQGLRALPPPPRGHPPRAPPGSLATAPALHLRRPDLRSPHSRSHLRSPLPDPRKRPNNPPRRRPHPHRLRHRLALPPPLTPDTPPPQGPFPLRGKVRMGERPPFALSLSKGPKPTAVPSLPSPPSVVTVIA